MKRYQHSEAHRMSDSTPKAQERVEKAHLEISIHDDLLLVCVLERLAPLDRPWQDCCQRVVVVFRVPLQRCQVCARRDGCTPLQTRDVTS